METTTTTQKPKQKRIRRKRLDLQLESALRDAEAALSADGATKYLITTRLNVLSQQLARERSAKLEEALTEVKRLSAENERLKQELECAKHELRATASPRPMTDIEQALQNYEQEKRRNDEHQV